MRIRPWLIVREAWRTLFYREPQLITGIFGKVWPTIEAYRQDARRALDQLTLLSTVKSASGVPLFVVVRNEAPLLPSFFQHYRELGVRHFIVVDNNSDDGSTEFLRAQPDVMHYHTAASYKDANSGSLWLDALIEKHAMDRWVLVVDSDEYLVFPKAHGTTINQLIADLERANASRILAPLFDLYNLAGDDREFYDDAPDRIEIGNEGLGVRGGVRSRLGALSPTPIAPLLSKYPLTFYDEHTIHANIHSPRPFRRNEYIIRARLLHRKLIAWSPERLKRNVQENQHWRNSLEYRQYINWYDNDLRCEFSRPYVDADDLLKRGFIHNW
jgi:glycosyltransferase involved in cell wall biosynthesis